MSLYLENRPTDLRKIAKAIAIGMAVAVPVLLFVAPLLSRINTSGVSVGESVRHPTLGEGRIDTVNSWEGTAYVEFETTRVVLPLSEL